jgi:hypothetical protein
VAWRDLPERFGQWRMFWADGTAVRSRRRFARK